MCYAVSLVQGDTIQGGEICLRTLRRYITDVFVFFQRRRIPTVDPDSTNFIEIIITTLKNYESVPNRCSIMTDTMFV